MEERSSILNFKIVLYQPEIPANTGNIGRLCVGCNSQLHLIKPMRFFINDKYIKRAGLDYWQKLDLKLHDSYECFLKNKDESNIYYFSTKAEKSYTDIDYQFGDYLVFGPESRGLPEDIIFSSDNKGKVVRIPMSDKIRSINLSNSVAAALYEAWRQQNFINNQR